MPARKKAGKRNRFSDSVGPLTALKTHSITRANVRDTIVSFGAEHGTLLVPVERRIARYLRQKRLYAYPLNAVNGESNLVRGCYSLDVETAAWVAEAEALMLEPQSNPCLAVLHGELWVLGSYNV